MPNCLNCGQEFFDRKHKDRKYCSDACHHESTKATWSDCPICGKSFRVTHKGHCFCSALCGGKGRSRYKGDPSKKAEYVCEICGKPFKNWRSRKNRVCSKRCAGVLGNQAPKKPRNNGHVTLVCQECGQPYKVAHYFVTVGNSKFCSNECKYKGASKSKRGAGNINYRGGTIRYRGQNWGAQRRLALMRDGYRCQICKKKQKQGKHWQLAVHHIKPYREFNNDYDQANQISNLITLCYSCHAKVEHGHLACPVHLL